MAKEIIQKLLVEKNDKKKQKKNQKKNKTKTENLKEPIELASKNVGKKDYKTVLQEELQKNGAVIIEYTIIKEEGPDHSKLFTAEVKCNGKALATGTGSNNKQAEMEAANKALTNMKIRKEIV